MLKESGDFTLRGNAADMAVGIIIGAAFGAIVQSLVADVIMPPIGLLLGKVDFANLRVVLKAGATPGPHTSLAEAHAAGAVTLNYGQFINHVFSFAIVAFAVFLIVKQVNRLRSPAPAPATKDCAYCFSAVAVKATRCAHYTSDLGAAA
jgi:large conductance mechanosensitive channel